MGHGENITAVELAEPQGLSSRRATLALWRSGSMVERDMSIGEQLPPGWTKAITDDGSPYYMNHSTRETQWVDPRLDSALLELAIHNDIKFAVYRTAAKVRDLQVYTRLSSVKLSTFENAMYALGYSTVAGSSPVKGEKISAILLETFANLANSISSVEVLTSWILKMFDKKRSGSIRIIELKLAIAALSSGWLEEKYKFMFNACDEDNDGYLTGNELANTIVTLQKIVGSFQEGWAFNPTIEGVEHAVSQCLALERTLDPKNISESVSIRTFLVWAMNEPRCFIWLPTLHRIAATENAKHEAHCKMCHAFPIMGFRYRCMTCVDVDVCQDCFWTGQYRKGHKAGHKMKEYCFQSSTKNDVKDFGTRLKYKITKPFRKKDPKENEDTADIKFRITEEPVTTIRNNEEEVVVPEASVPEVLAQEPTPRSLNDEHEAIQSLTERINQHEANSVHHQAEARAREAREKEMRDMLDQLEFENRNLVQQVIEARQEALNASENPEVQDMASQNMMMKSQVNDLHFRNQELVNQLNNLRSMIGPIQDATSRLNQAKQQQAPVQSSLAVPQTMSFNMDCGSSETDEPTESSSDPSEEMEDSFESAKGRPVEMTPQEEELVHLSQDMKSALQNQPSKENLEQQKLVQAAQQLSAELKESAEEMEAGVTDPKVQAAQDALVGVQDRQFERKKESLDNEIEGLKNTIQRLSTDDHSKQVSDAMMHEQAMQFGEDRIQSSLNRTTSQRKMSLSHLTQTARFVHLKLQVQNILGMTLRGVEDENIVTSLLQKFQNGYLLCRIANAKLQKAGLTLIQPWRAKGGERLSTQHIAENMDSFLHACAELDVQGDLVPSLTDLMGLRALVEDEGDGEPSPRALAKMQALSSVLEELLSK